MARRKLTLRRIDPWTVLKFGFVLNVCLLAIGVAGFGIVWWGIQRLELIEQACELATSVGIENCGVEGGNLFRWFLLLGGLGVIIQTGFLVFFAFLFNLISDLVGGIGFGFLEEGGAAIARAQTTGGRAVDTSAATAPRQVGVASGNSSGAGPPATAAGTPDDWPWAEAGEDDDTAAMPPSEGQEQLFGKRSEP